MNRRTLKHIIEDPSSRPGTRPTIQGYRFILLTLLLGLAAVNTGNNLIYLILSMIGAMVTVSVVMLRGSLKGFDVRIHVPYPVHAGRRTSLGVTLMREIPRPGFDIHVRLPDEPPLGASGRARFGRVEGSGTATCALPFVPKRRGRLSLGGLLLATGFPFGLIMKTSLMPRPQSILVYPALIPVRSLTAALSGAASGRYTHRPAPDGEYLLDREYRYGDSLRHVHWKASARTGRILVKEYSREEPVRVTLCLETGPGIDPDLFERAVTVAASVAAFLSEKDLYLRLVCGQIDTAYGPGREHLYRILDALALVQSATVPAPLPGPGSGYLIGVSVNPSPPEGWEGYFDHIINAQQQI